MAKLNKGAMGLLSSIVAAAAANSNFYVKKEPNAEALVTYDPPLIQVDTNVLDPSDNTKCAARPTEAGKVMVANTQVSNASSQASANPVTGSSPYQVMSGIELPKSKPRGAGAGAPTVYPFEQLKIGDFFFVPRDTKNTDPVKKLQSTVSANNLKLLAVNVGMKTVERTKRGEKNRAVVDPATGQKVKERVTIPEYKYTSEKGKFTIRAVEAGKMYGPFQAPTDGAVIARIAIED